MGGVTRRHRRDDSSSVAHRAKEEVSSRVAASLRRIGSADPSPRLGSWSRVAPRLPQKTLKSHKITVRMKFDWLRRTSVPAILEIGIGCWQHFHSGNIHFERPPK